MSQLKVNTIRHTGGSADNITLDNSQNVTVEGNLTVDGTLTASQRSNRNLIINGAMQVAQRGTSSTSNGYKTIDRWYWECNGADETATISQEDVSLGTSPYNLPVGSGHPYAHGFRKCLQVLNGNQTGGAGVSDAIDLVYAVEAQDLAQSGWDYTSSSSYITFSFWIKSSVAQNFYGYIRSQDGTSKDYAYETGSLTQHTWTKITKSIPGDSGLTINTDNGKGIAITILPFMGTGSTNNSKSLNSWANIDNAARTPDNTTTWWTTNDATFQITGVQLEVGSVATDFEHRSYGDELQRCLRYCQRHAGVNGSRVAIGVIGDSTTGYASFPTKVPMRATPSISVTEAGKIVKEGSAWYDLTSLTIGTSTNDVAVLTCVVSGGHNMSALDPFTMGDSTDFTLNSEL